MFGFYLVMGVFLNFLAVIMYEDGQMGRSAFAAVVSFLNIYIYFRESSKHPNQYRPWE